VSSTCRAHAVTIPAFLGFPPNRNPRGESRVASSIGIDGSRRLPVGDAVEVPNEVVALLSHRRRGSASKGGLAVKKPEQRLRNDAGFGTPFSWGYFGEL
jgi:hypothetical protein